MKESREKDTADNNDDNLDEEFEIIWKNWSSRRKCESTHQKEHLQDFKKKFNPTS